MKHKAAIWIFCLLLVSCEGDIFIGYRWTGMRAVHADNLGENPAPTQQNTLPARAYVLRLELPFEEVSRSRGRYIDTESPPENTNPVDSISITATTAFSAAYPAGARLNELFVLYSGSYLQTRTPDSFYLTNVYNSDYTDHPIPDHADLLLMHSPDSVRAMRFRVYLHFSDNSEMIDTTGTIVLQP